MKVEMKPVIDSNDLGEQIKAQYNLDLCIPEVLFPEDFMNDCFKEYYYKDVWEDEVFPSDEACVRKYLCDTLPQYDSILVKISW